MKNRIKKEVKRGEREGGPGRICRLWQEWREQGFGRELRFRAYRDPEHQRIWGEERQEGGIGGSIMGACYDLGPLRGL